MAEHDPQRVETTQEKTQEPNLLSWRQGWMPLSMGVMGAVVLSIVGWWWTSTPWGKNSLMKPSALVSLGESVFRKAGCWYCHHPALSEMRWGAMSLPFAHESGWVAYFYDPKTLRGQSAKSAHRKLLQPRADGRMELNTEGKALVAYLRTASQSSFVPERKTQGLVPLSLRAQTEPGLPLYQKLCASCHGSRGFGDGPLASILPEKPRDLTRPNAWLCRSNQSASVVDIQRTILHQTGGCGLLSVERVLSKEQQTALTDAVRRIAGINRAILPHSALQHPPPEPPKPASLRSREFRDWVHAAWEREYDRWLTHWRSLYGKQAYIPFRHWRDWKDDREWHGFSRWMGKHHHTIHLSLADWQTAMQQNPRVRDIFQEWLVRGRKRPWIKFLQQRLRQKLSKELTLRYESYLRTNKRQWPWYQFWGAYSYRRNWMSYEMRSEWPRYLRRYDFVAYQEWREQKERDLFRSWLETQQGELYWAWKGEMVYQNMGCVRCHGKQGQGLSIPVTSSSPISANFGSTTHNTLPHKMLQVRNLTRETLRCGTSWSDVYRSIVVGVGEQMTGLASQDIQTYLRQNHVPSHVWHPRSGDKRIERFQQDLWALAAYIRFLNRQLPILKGIQ